MKKNSKIILYTTSQLILKSNFHYIISYLISYCILSDTYMYVENVTKHNLMSWWQIGKCCTP